MKRIGLAGLFVTTFTLLLLFWPRWMQAAGTDYEVEGQVVLLTENSRHAKDASKVVEWLTPLGPLTGASSTVREYEMIQRDKKFDPDLLVVPVGSVVRFPNLDPWFHNVFSLYRGKRFDLGLYQAGDAKAVRFDRLGPSYIFCNIHPQMSAVILTVDSKLFGLSEKFGHIAISGVPQGRYRLNVWYQNADGDSLGALARDVMVDGSRDLPTVSIVVVPHDLRNHKNKFGQDYDRDALSPSY